MSWRLILRGPKDNYIYFPLNYATTNYEGHKVTEKYSQSQITWKKFTESGHNMITSM